MGVASTSETAARMSKSEIQSHLAGLVDGFSDELGMRFFPVGLVWPMGFSWSSCVAQDKLLHLSHSAGLSDEQVLSCGAVTPCSFQLTFFSAANDDVMIFSNAGLGASAAPPRPSRFDRVMLKRVL